MLPYEKDLHIRKQDCKSSLFIKGLTKEMKHTDLFELFKDFGEILSAKVSVDADHNSRGYGYIQFAKEDEALRALQQVNSFND